MYFKDLHQDSDFGFFKVGWLESGFEYTKGSIDTKLIHKLKEVMSASLMQTKGTHACPFCTKAHGSKEALILSKTRVYHVPEMIVHYIQDHEYQPPQEFLHALYFTPLPETPDHQQRRARLGYAGTARRRAGAVQSRAVAARARSQAPCRRPVS